MDSTLMPERAALRVAALAGREPALAGHEHAFDDVARLAASLCRTPVALVSLVAGDRQVIEGQAGLDGVELSRDLSLCTHAPGGSDLLEIPDLAADPRFADHPLVAAGPRLRACAGAPLLDRHGRALGTLCVLDVAPRRLDDEQRRGLQTLARQVVAQIELLRLDRAVTAQAADLARARGEALAATRARDVFLANMGHELRTPLNAILGCAELLREEATEGGLQHLVSDLQAIERSGRHLVAVIEDILDLARLQAGVPQLRRSTVALADVVEELQAVVRPQLRGKDLRWRVVVEPDLGDMFTDPTKLRQILINLLSNAIKFTAAGAIELEVRRVREGERELLAFAVSDTGIGIAADKLALLFRDFSQVHEPDASYGGTGLGLAISRRFARLLGGDILVDSEVGRGSRFTLLLPADPSDPA